MRIGGIILAGGLSRRLGQPKQMLPFGDGTLLEHAIRQAEAVTEIDGLIVVLPPSDAVPDPCHTRATVVRREATDGCSGSLRAGLAAVGGEADAVVILPADQPGLTSELIAVALRAWRRTTPAALTLSFNGTPGHPLIFSGALLDRLRSLHGEKGLWRLLEDLGDEVERIEVHIDVPVDVDAWEDYERLCAQYPEAVGTPRSSGDLHH